MAYLWVPDGMIELMGMVSENPLVVLLLSNPMLLFLGTFMDTSPLIVITMPIFLPLVTDFGFDPIYFGVIMSPDLGIALNTPPLGPVRFVAAAAGEITIWEAMRSIWPFQAAGLTRARPRHLCSGPFAPAARLERIPAGRWGEVEDIGAITVLLASPAANDLHGAIISVDGGWFAH